MVPHNASTAGLAQHMLNGSSTDVASDVESEAEAAEPVFFGIEVQLAVGAVHKIEAAAGFSAMELMRAAGLPIVAECGGAGVCATCHCRVPAAWAARLPAATDDEQQKLDEIPSADDWSRLSCQIRMTPEFDGLVLELQPDSIRPNGN
jgi:ferredoxin, 2Fe-2S